jgi:acyl-CoA hydrolase
MDVVTIETHHLVKSEDLNHHGSLYAGRCAEWFVESGFIAAASLAHPKNIVCLKVHGMTFTRVVHAGEIANFCSKVVFVGRTRLVANIQMKVGDENVVSGFITFIHVDEAGKPLPHGLEIVPTRPEDINLQEQARAL